MADEKKDGEKASGVTMKGGLIVAGIALAVVYFALGTTFDGFGLGKMKKALFVAAGVQPPNGAWPASWN